MLRWRFHSEPLRSVATQSTPRAYFASNYPPLRPADHRLPPLRRPNIRLSYPPFRAFRFFFLLVFFHASSFFLFFFQIVVVARFALESTTGFAQVTNPPCVLVSSRHYASEKREKKTGEEGDINSFFISRIIFFRTDSKFFLPPYPPVRPS